MTPARYPSLQVRFLVQRVEGNEWALVDTGFDGHLAIPEALVDRLPEPMYLRRVRTASGQVFRAPIYLGSIEFVDQPGPIDALIIALGDEYLLGLPVLNHLKVTFDHGQRLTVEP